MYIPLSPSHISDRFEYMAIPNWVAHHRPCFFVQSLSCRVVFGKLQYTPDGYNRVVMRCTQQGGSIWSCPNFALKMPAGAIERVE